MSRSYSTNPTMFEDRFTQKVVQPDKKLVETLHQLLDAIPDDNHALSIDMVVADLLKFHNPNQSSLIGAISISMPKEEPAPRIIYVDRGTGQQL